MDVRVGLWRKLSTKELMLLNCGVQEDYWEPLGLRGERSNQSILKEISPGCSLDWCWGWNSNTLATSCKELTHWKRPWCWEGLGAGGEGDNRGWDGWMASPTWWTWVWVNSGSWWWTGRPGMLRFMGSQRVGHDWATELNWGSSVHGILQARMLECVPIPLSRDLSDPETKPESLALQADSLPSEPPGMTKFQCRFLQNGDSKTSQSSY